MWLAITAILLQKQMVNQSKRLIDCALLLCERKKKRKALLIDGVFVGILYGAGLFNTC